MLNNSRIDLNKEESINLEHREITHIEPHRDKYLVNLHDYVNKYKTDYARLGPFLTSFARRQMYLTFKDVEECVYRVHTDGVVVSKKLSSAARCSCWGVEGGISGKMRGGECEQGRVVVSCYAAVAFIMMLLALLFHSLLI